jgi:hypothetical protein
MTSKTKEPLNDVMARIAKDAADNTLKLMNCSRHLYDLRPYDGPFSVKVLHCVRCQGRHATHAALAYIDGYLSTGRPLGDVAINAQGLRLAPRCVCPRCEGKSAPDDVRAWPEGTCTLCLSVGSLPRAAAIEWLEQKRGKVPAKPNS